MAAIRVFRWRQFRRRRSFVFSKRAATTVTRDVTTDAAVSTTATRDVTTDAAVSTTATRDVTTDAAVSTTATRDVTTDAVITATVTRDVTTDASTTAPITRDVTTDATITVDVTRDVTTDAAVSATATRDLTTDAVITTTVTRDVTTDAAIYYGIKDVATDASITTNPTLNITTDAAISATATQDVTTDAVVSQTATRDVSTDAATTNPVTRDVTTTAAITGYVSRDVTTTASISNSDRARDVTTDASITVPLLGGLRIDIYNGAGTAKIGQGPITEINSISYKQSVDEIGSATVVLSLQDPCVSGITGLSQLWLYRVGEGYVFRGEVIDRIKKAGTLTVQLLGIEAALRESDVPAGTIFTDASPTLVATTLLSGTGWTLGDVGGTFAKLNADLGFMTVWQALLFACKVFGFHLRVDQANKRIDFSKLGEDSGLVLLQPEAATQEMAANAGVAIVTHGEEKKSRIQLINSITAVGVGAGWAALGMEAANRSNNLILDGDFERLNHDSSNVSLSLVMSVKSPYWQMIDASGDYDGTVEAGSTNYYLKTSYSLITSSDYAMRLLAQAVDNSASGYPAYTTSKMGWRQKGPNETIWGDSVGRLFHAEVKVRYTKARSGGYPTVTVECRNGTGGAVVATRTINVSAAWTTVSMDWMCLTSGAKWPLMYVYASGGSGIDTFGDALWINDAKVIDKTFSNYEVTTFYAADGRRMTKIEDTASIALNGRHSKYLAWKLAAPTEASYNAFIKSSNTLFDLAANTLSRVKDEITEFSADVIGVRSTQFKLGQKARTIYYSAEDAIDVDAAYWIMGAKRKLDKNGSTWEFELSSVDLPTLDDQEANSQITGNISQLFSEIAPSNIELQSYLAPQTVPTAGVRVLSDFRGVTAVAKVILEIQKVPPATPFALYSVEVINADGRWTIYGQGGTYLNDPVSKAQIDVTPWFRHWPTSVPYYDMGDVGPSGYFGPYVEIKQISGSVTTVIEARLRALVYKLPLKPGEIDAYVNPTPPPPEPDVAISLRQKGTLTFGNTVNGGTWVDPIERGCIVMFVSGYQGTIVDTQNNTWRSVGNGWYYTYGMHNWVGPGAYQIYMAGLPANVSATAKVYEFYGMKWAADPFDKVVSVPAGSPRLGTTQHAASAGLSLNTTVPNELVLAVNQSDRGQKSSTWNPPDGIAASVSGWTAEVGESAIGAVYTAAYRVDEYRVVAAPSTISQNFEPTSYSTEGGLPGMQFANHDYGNGAIDAIVFKGAL